jgi:hypothetical protein
MVSPYVCRKAGARKSSEGSAWLDDMMLIHVLRRVKMEQDG